MSDSSYRIPQDIDAPIPIFMWEITEVIVAVMVVGVAIIMRMFLPGIVVAIFLMMLAKRMRAGQKRGQVQHVLWRLGLRLDPLLSKFGPRPMRLEYMR
ncbi:MAG: type IV conjugative transfer system protein TraL [Billgrantia desiderata]